jgi:hypothetical protein
MALKKKAPAKRSKKRQPDRWHVIEAGPIYCVPKGVDNRPLPSTLQETETEMLLLLGAMETVERNINNKCIASSWDGYRALAHSLKRQTWFSDELRDAFRRTHLIVPTFMGSAITSYHEAAFEVCGARLDFLHECISRVNIDSALPYFEQLVLRGSALAKEVDYVVRNWHFTNLDFAELLAGVQLECTSAAEQEQVHHKPIPNRQRKRGRRTNPTRDANICGAVDAGKSQDTVAQEFGLTTASAVSKACKRHRNRQKT